ncbi:hypothetical protein Dimus_005459 [Dionaea muscipula]
MTADVITWTPFGSTPDRVVPITLFNGIIHCRSITEPYMPDRVLRQFGFVQVPPSDPFQPKEVYRGPETSKYKCRHDKMRQLWDAWHNHLIKPIVMGSRRACYATEHFFPFLTATFPLTGAKGSGAAASGVGWCSSTSEEKFELGFLNRCSYHK